MENINEIKFNKEENNIILFINGEKAGFLNLGKYSGNVYQINKIEISAEFRNMGFYKQLLIAGINMNKAEMLISNYRNSYSNPIYKKWTGNEELENEDQVNVYIFGENIYFDIDSEN